MYLLELKEFEHGIKLGLAMCLKKLSQKENEEQKWNVAWFEILSKTAWSCKNVAFKQFKENKKRTVTPVTIESFRLLVDDTSEKELTLNCLYTFSFACNKFVLRVLYRFDEVRKSK